MVWVKGRSYCMETQQIGSIRRLLRETEQDMRRLTDRDGKVRDACVETDSVRL